MKRSICAGGFLVVLLMAVSTAGASDPLGLWQAAPAGKKAIQKSDPNDTWIRPDHAIGLSLDLDAMKLRLQNVPKEGTAARNPVHITLPLGDGTYGRFAVEETSVMEPGLAARYPELRTYIARELDDPACSARFDVTPRGFHGLIFTRAGDVYIDPTSRTDDRSYSCYYRKHYRRADPAEEAFSCTLHHVAENAAQPKAAAQKGNSTTAAKTTTGASLRTYRLAMTADADFTAFYGGVSQALAGMVTGMNRINGIYERDVAVRMVLVANNDQLIFTSANDPHNGNLDGITAIIDGVIGNANYDIGHLVQGGSGGGVAYLGVVCDSGLKGNGLTGSTTPNNDPFWVDFVAHEIGHQFGGNHTFNGTGGSCSGGNRNGSTAYEPGSGSTVMAYAGICGADDLQNNSDAYFHAASIEEINAHVTGSAASCVQNTNTGNNPPVASAGADYTIPRQTSFELTGSATDANGDSLT
ncbi:MAG: reprolysin-like metallopeptidase, partial [Verrucomicrobiota bacterium]